VYARGFPYAKDLTHVPSGVFRVSTTSGRRKCSPSVASRTRTRDNRAGVLNPINRRVQRIDTFASIDTAARIVVVSDGLRVPHGSIPREINKHNCTRACVNRSAGSVFGHRRPFRRRGALLRAASFFRTPLFFLHSYYCNNKKKKKTKNTYFY